MMLRPMDIVPRESIIAEPLAPSSHVKEFLEQFGHEVRNRLEKTSSELMNNIPNLLDSKKSSQVVNNINQQLNDTNNLLKNLTLYKEFINPEEYQEILGTAKLIPITINLMSTIPMIPVMLKSDSGSKQISNFLQDLQDKINEVEKIINSHSSNLWDQSSTYELFSIIDQVGSVLRTDQPTIDSVKELTKNILLEQNPREFLVTLASSASGLIHGLYKIKSSVEHDSTYIDLIKQSIEKLPSLKGDTTNYILQLACELLKAGDIQGALDIFKSSREPELSLQPIYQFNIALALTETRLEDNLREAAEILNRIKSNEVISKDKINFLLTINTDCRKDYESAEKYYLKLSKNYQPETLFEKVIFLKYQFKSDVEVRQELVSLREENLVEFDEILDKLNDSDLLFIIGDGYFDQGNITEANNYFIKCCDTIIGNTFLVKSDNNYPMYRIINCASKANNEDLFFKVKNIFEPTGSFSETVKDCLLENIVKNNIKESKFILKNIISSDLNLAALNTACDSNNIEIVQFLLNMDSDNILFDKVNTNLDLKPIQYAALRAAHEDGDINIIRSFLEKYKSSGINIDESMLFYIDSALQQGPSYIQDQYREDVHKILEINLALQDNCSDSFDW